MEGPSRHNSLEGIEEKSIKHDYTEKKIKRSIRKTNPQRAEKKFNNKYSDKW